MELAIIPGRPRVGSFRRPAANAETVRALIDRRGRAPHTLSKRLNTLS
jgi:hypothetical protein